MPAVFHAPRRRVRFAIVFALAVCLLFAASPDAARAADHKFALAMFHFNIQYVAGGLRGFLPLGLDNVIPSWEMTEAEVEDMIIVESFEPVLDLYLDHPGWGVDLELQSYFIEVLAERHPGILAKLIDLVESGQASVVSFHYSDQLFIGYPRRAWETSAERTAQVFADAGVALSPTVFCQEGQAGVGMAEAMSDFGYDLMVWPKNLWIYQHGDFASEPYYDFGGLDLIVGAQGVNWTDGDDTLEMTWTFLGDGELLATCDFDPYFPPVFKENAACIAEYVDQLTALEADGWDIARADEYVAQAKDLGIAPAEMPDLLDGTWQPDSTNGPFRWLGGGGLWRMDERDNHVRTLCEIAFRELLAAEVAADEAGIDAEDEIGESWRLLNLGMVTDATGINPYKGEIGYGVAHCGEVARRARTVIERAKIETGITTARIDTAAGEMAQADFPPDYDETTAPAVEVTIDTKRREAVSRWSLVSSTPEIYQLEIEFDDDVGREVSVTFEGTATDLVFTPALSTGGPLTYDRTAFVFNEWPMPLADGFLNLGDDWYVVKDMGLTHVAAFINTDNGNARFEDDTATPGSAFTWRFFLIHGTQDEAVAFATGLNVSPTLYR
ncbi:MAG: hypothetical protein IT350_20400 [Deltaproteobacteria bacterium]|nr:hypothetical protein [Deltaproteobacteria bacterium]